MRSTAWRLASTADLNSGVWTSGRWTNRSRNLYTISRGCHQLFSSLRSLSLAHRYSRTHRRTTPRPVYLSPRWPAHRRPQSLAFINQYLASQAECRRFPQHFARSRAPVSYRYCCCRSLLVVVPNAIVFIVVVVVVYLLRHSITEHKLTTVSEQARSRCFLDGVVVDDVNTFIAPLITLGRDDRTVVSPTRVGLAVAVCPPTLDFQRNDRSTRGLCG